MKSDWSMGKIAGDGTVTLSGRTAITAPDRQADENAHIAARLKARDPLVVDDLIVRHQHRLMRHLIYLCGDRELAEDLFQETWMRVITRGAQFRGNSQFVTWLFTVARNLVFDMRRRIPPSSSFEALTESGDERAIGPPTREESAFDRYVAEENNRLITEAIATLSLQQREVILLRFREELPLQDIATITQAPLSTVKARLYRALSMLRTRILARTGG